MDGSALRRQRHLRRHMRPAGLVAQLRRHARILQNVRDSIIVTDRTGTITYWNDGAAALFEGAPIDICAVLYSAVHTKHQRVLRW
jgi:PAS domain-containing protein